MSLSPACARAAGRADAATHVKQLVTQPQWVSPSGTCSWIYCTAVAHKINFLPGVSPLVFAHGNKGQKDLREPLARCESNQSNVDIFQSL
jgi:hypothetical protein